MLTPDQLAEIEATEKAASPGPWEPGDIWLTAGLIWDADHKRVDPKTATHCGYCGIGEPVWTGRADINGTVMRAHRHRDPEPYEPDHKISGADGASVAGNYDYEVGGILRPEDTAFICAARTAMPALLAEVKRLRQRIAEAVKDARERDERLLALRDRTASHDKALGLERGARDVRSIADFLDGREG